MLLRVKNPFFSAETSMWLTKTSTSPIPSPTKRLLLALGMLVLLIRKETDFKILSIADGWIHSGIFIPKNENPTRGGVILAKPEKKMFDGELTIFFRLPMLKICAKMRTYIPKYSGVIIVRWEWRLSHNMYFTSYGAKKISIYTLLNTIYLFVSSKNVQGRFSLKVRTFYFIVASSAGDDENIFQANEYS